MHGDTVWFVFDTDMSEKEGKIAPLCKFCDEQNRLVVSKYDEVKPYKAWNVAQSNPCFEIWLFYHFFDTKPKDYDSERYTSFKEYVNAQISGGFNFQAHPVYLQEAMANAKKNFQLDTNGKLDLYCTEMFKLGEEILSFTKRELSKLRNKLG